MNFIYSKFLEKLMLQEIFLLSGAQPADEFKVALINKNYSPSQQDNKKYSDLVELGYECKDPNAEAYASENKGYQPGGKEVIFKLMSSDTVYTYLTCNNVSWIKSTITPRYAVIYRVKDGTLISCFDFGKDQVVENGRFAINWNGDAVLTIQTDMYYEQPDVNEIADIIVETFGPRPEEADSGVKVTISLTNGQVREFKIYDGFVDEMLDIDSDNSVKNKAISQEFNRKIDSVAINDIPLEPIQIETTYGSGILHNKINIEIESISKATIRYMVLGEE